MISAKRKSLTEGGYDPHLSTHLSGCILIKNFQNSYVNIFIKIKILRFKISNYKIEVFLSWLFRTLKSMTHPF